MFIATRFAAESECNNESTNAFCDNLAVKPSLSFAPPYAVAVPVIPPTVDFPATSPQSIASRLPFS